jgi:gamma-glutamyl hercynylcysteine S-oxide synthase
MKSFPAQSLRDWVIDARARTLDMVSDLSEEQWDVPLLRTINPFLWEIGHVGYFQEYWVLRHAGQQSQIRSDADALYDSAKVAHDTRWRLELPSRAATIEYLKIVRDRVLDRIEGSGFDERDAYFVRLSVFHEDMHAEALTITRQTLAYPMPAFSGLTNRHTASSNGLLTGDAVVPGGTYSIGSSPQEMFVFDNEKWRHPVQISEFQIARAPVTQSEFARFIEDAGYARPELWTTEGWAWRQAQNAECPIYWKRDRDRGWIRRHFNQWLELEADHPVTNVCWFEAEAYCRWAGRRLPTEFEWEVAAQDSGSAGDANLDLKEGGCCGVGAHPAGDSTYGCRQMIGNAWEWTSSDFLPYAGFSPDPYSEYSMPWFGDHKTLRGGAWSTRSRLIRPQYRNFYTPDRRDMWAGFRTCDLQS